MKILLLSHRFYPDVGGIETISEYLANKFFEAGKDVRLVTWSKDNTQNHDYSYEVIRDPTVWTLLKSHHWADVVFENNPCLRLAWPNILFKKPRYIGIQTWVLDSTQNHPITERIKKFWLSRAKKVIACSDSIRDRCWPEAVTIRNAYQDQIFKKIDQIPRTQDFVFLGRLVSDKGADQAIMAFHHIVAEEHSKGIYKNRTMNIIGNGPEKSNLIHLVEKLGMKSSISFLGLLKGEALVKILNQHKYILIPSIWEEPFGIVALEAMACGCIPIVSDGGGLPEAVGGGGLTFRRKDLQSLIDTIKLVSDNSDVAQKLLEEGKNHLLKHHLQYVADQYLEILNTPISN